MPWNGDDMCWLECGKHVKYTITCITRFFAKPKFTLMCMLYKKKKPSDRCFAGKYLRWKYFNFILYAQKYLTKGKRQIVDKSYIIREYRL